MSEDVFSPNLDVLDGESVDMYQGDDTQAQEYSDCLSGIDQSGMIPQQSRSQHYDSGDSDDYAESDNWSFFYLETRQIGGLIQSWRLSRN